VTVSQDSLTRQLTDCGCCEELAARTPLAVSNRPGLSAIAYRIGTQGQFFQTMLARLADSRQPVLRDLTARDRGDFAIALLDAWATVADVLTFYQERLANESYLRSATERRSLLELARLIGYQLRPGVAASAYLAFTLEEAAFTPGTPTPAETPPLVIDAGVKAQSVPGPGESAQVFETIEKIEARAAWNAIQPRLTQPQKLTVDLGSVLLQGTATNLKPGDVLLIVDAAGERQPRRVLHVTPDNDAQTTRVDFVLSPSPPPIYQDSVSLLEGKVRDFNKKGSLDSSLAASLRNRRWQEGDLAALAKLRGWPAQELVAALTASAGEALPSEAAGVFAFRQRAAIFGHNAPKWDSLPTEMRYEKRIPRYQNNLFLRYDTIPPAFPAPGWESQTLEADAQPQDSQRTIFLDSTYPGIIPGSWLVLAAPATQGGGVLAQAFRVTENVETTRSDFALSLKVSRLQVESPQPFPGDFKMRTTSVLGQSDRLALAELPIDDPIAEDIITLDKVYLGLQPGKRIILSGERKDLPGVLVSEVRLLQEVTVAGGFTVIRLDKALEYQYVRSTVKINANLAQASHGETVHEVLGSGNAAQSFQRFTLRQPPLTYVSAGSAGGAASTLEVRVNDLLWHEVENFAAHGPEERIYVTLTDDDGNTQVIFGDGETGARLPTGQENVKAKYRKGLGLAGMVKANQLTQLLTRPLGLKEVTNPLAAAGAADRENLADARRNAPLTVLTLGRVVSLKDYEDFARAFPGIDKTLATWTWSGQRRRVFVTVAGSQGEPVLTDSTLHTNLVAALRQAGNPRVPLKVESYQPKFFRLAAQIRVQSDFLEDLVMLQVQEKLRQTFSFAAREFGQPVTLSEVMAVIQNLRGVAAVQVTEFYWDDPARVEAIVEAALPGLTGDQVSPAELLLLDPRPVKLERMS
jgi:hypothetical protein